MLPEIVLLAHTDDMLRADAHMLGPDIKRLVVLFIYAYPETVCRHAENLGTKLPGPSRGFLLEIIPEAKIPEHFKICAVACGFPYPFDVGGAYTLLTSGHPLVRRGKLAGKILFHRRHAGINQQKRFVVLRNQEKLEVSDDPCFQRKTEIFSQFI